MREWIPNLPDSDRRAIKNSVMTSLYGSVKEPENQFGKDSEELDAFHKAMYKTCPLCMQLLEALRNSWDSNTLAHKWKLPDGYDAVVKVMQSKKAKIEIDELNGMTFTYIYKVNEAKEKGVSNVANPVHSVDAYVLRSLERRCNYDLNVINRAYDLIVNEELRRSIGGEPYGEGSADNLTKVEYYIEQYERSTVADVVIAPYLDKVSVKVLSDQHLVCLHNIVEAMLQYAPFSVITVHDEFKCHPNNMNHLRFQYNQILAELADSELLNDLLTQLYKEPVTWNKGVKDLSKHIRKSNYAIC
jgi:hypothetical protein